MTVALLGVDNAGKSTLLTRMKGEYQEFIAPTIGFASEVVTQGSHTIKIYDLGGGANIRGIWPRYYAELHGAVFVIDSSDRSRMPVAREVLHQTLEHSRFANKPLLVMANKQDKTEPMSSAEIASSLGLEKFKGLQYSIVTCSALALEENIPPDPRIAQGLKWLTGAIDSNYTVLQKRIQQDSAEQKEEERIEREEKRKRVEARRRERELEREREAEGNSKEMHTITNNAPNNTSDKITVIRDATPRSSQDKTIVKTLSFKAVPATDLFDKAADKGRDMFKNGGEVEVHSARKLKTPRSVYSSTTIMIKPDDGGSEQHIAVSSIEDTAATLPNGISDDDDHNNNTHPSAKVDNNNSNNNNKSNLPPLQLGISKPKAKLETTPSPMLHTLHPLPPLERPPVVV